MFGPNRRTQGVPVSPFGMAVGPGIADLSVPGMDAGTGTGVVPSTPTTSPVATFASAAPTNQMTRKPYFGPLDMLPPIH